MALRRRAAEVRRARVAVRNDTKGETFAREVPPEMFDMFEALYEAPAPAEMEGAVLNVTDKIAGLGEAPGEALQ